MTEQEEILEKVQAALMILALGELWPPDAPYVACAYLRTSIERLGLADANQARLQAARRALVEHPKELMVVCHPFFVQCGYCQDGPSQPREHCQSAKTIGNWMITNGN